MVPSLLTVPISFHSYISLSYLKEDINDGPVSGGYPVIGTILVIVHEKW